MTSEQNSSEHARRIEALELQVRRLEQEKLSHQRRAQRYRDILDQVPEALCRLQGDGVLSYVNRACCQALDASPEDLIGRNFLQRFPPSDQQRLEASWQRLSTTAPSIDVRGLTERQDTWQFLAFFDNSGKLAAMQGQRLANPLPVAGPQKAAANSGSSPKSPGANPSDASDAEPGGLILVVDDEHMVCTLAQKVLEKFSFHVLVAQTGKAALAAFGEQHHAIRAVLLDMSLPDIDGKQVFAELRRLQPNIRVIVSSGYDTANSVKRLSSHGVAFLPKPYMPDQLIQKVREILS